MNSTGVLFSASDAANQAATELVAQNLNTLYVVIASIVLQVIMLGNKIYKKIQIKRKMIPTNSKLLKELKKIRTPSVRNMMADMKKSQKSMRRAKVKAIRRLSAYQEANKEEVSNDDDEQDE